MAANGVNSELLKTCYFTLIKGRGKQVWEKLRVIPISARGNIRVSIFIFPPNIVNLSNASSSKLSFHAPTCFFRYSKEGKTLNLWQSPFATALVQTASCPEYVHFVLFAPPTLNADRWVRQMPTVQKPFLAEATLYHKSWLNPSVLSGIFCLVF